MSKRGRMGTHVLCSQKYPSEQGLTPSLQEKFSNPLTVGYIIFTYGVRRRTLKNTIKSPTRLRPTTRDIFSIKDYTLWIYGKPCICWEGRRLSIYTIPISTVGSKGAGGHIKSALLSIGRTNEVFISHHKK